jgi:hypothetical protein
MCGQPAAGTAADTIRCTGLAPARDCARLALARSGAGNEGASLISLLRAPLS